MKGVRIRAYGGPEVLLYEDVPRPEPAPGDVLVRIHAAGINPVDWKIREGHLKTTLHHTFPLTLGWDFSGVVETLGAGTSRFKVGDEVYSRPDISRNGAYAEYIVVREREVALKPKTIDHLHAAALPLAGLTSWQTLIAAGGLTAGQRVLIHAAAGGVGHVAVQIAKWKGAHVIGTAGAQNHEFLRQLGADELIDYELQRFDEILRSQPVDVVLDTKGGDVQARSWNVLKRGGILVSITSPPSAEMATQLGVRQAFVFTEPNAAQLAEIATLVDAGKLKVNVETILPLAEATRGQEISERGHSRGKIVLQVA
jgi:NADPH:quinone reductase-like Zn-dependent oxidoreductase